MTRGTIGRQMSLKRLSTWPFDVSIQFQHSIPAFDFSIRFQHSISAFDFSIRFQHSISAFDFSIRFQHSISAFDFSIRYPSPSISSSSLSIRTSKTPTRLRNMRCEGKHKILSTLRFRKSLKRSPCHHVSTHGHESSDMSTYSHPATSSTHWPSPTS
jgi:hypothetical protein